MGVVEAPMCNLTDMPFCPDTEGMMDKEQYLLVGAVLGFGGAILGFMGAMITTLINRRTQLKLARETHQHQCQVEELKAHTQAAHEAQTCLRSKIEEAHQILSKMIMENSLTTSEITVETRMTAVEYHTRYQENTVELRRLQMTVALYFPQLQDCTNILADLTYQFWRYQQRVLRLWQMAPEGEGPPTPTPVLEIIEVSEKIREQACMAQNQLQALMYDTMPSLVVKGHTAAGI